MVTIMISIPIVILTSIMTIAIVAFDIHMHYLISCMYVCMCIYIYMYTSTCRGLNTCQSHVCLRYLVL